MAAVAGGASLPAGSPQGADLAITHATILDVRTGQTLADQTVLVANGIITSVSPTAVRVPDARRVIDAHGRLMTPGLFDVHLHVCNIFCDSSNAGGQSPMNLVMQPDSIAAYRRTFAGAYLPYGVTVVRDVGDEERVLPMLLSWMRRSAGAPDFYPSGAQLISPSPRHAPLPWQATVADSTAAVAKVDEYERLGIRNIKLYWRLNEPEFSAALHEAQRLDLDVTAHVDQQTMTIGQALDLGLRNVEHIHTLALSVMRSSELDSLYRQMPALLHANGKTPGVFYLEVPEYWNHIGSDDPRVLDLIAKFKHDDASLTPTLHIFAQRLGLTYFESPPRNAAEDTRGLTPEQRERAIAGYRIMASYVKRMYDAGIRLNTGTDTQEPGRSVLSEMLLLHKAGIPMADVFRMATLDSARDIGHGSEYGAVEIGRRADLVLFDGNPLAHPLDLLGGKSVIKDGVPWS
jgi:imidazolonepropionase-like amidohydrolase